MNNRVIYRLPALALGVAALGSGCFYDKEKIAFKDEQRIPEQAAESVVVPPVTKKLSKADEQAVQRTVFGYLLGRHFWEGGEYTGIFLQSSRPVEDALVRQFARHQPPVKPIYHAYLPTDRTPVDRDTGKAGMLLLVETGELNADDSVDCLGRWYGGPAVAGFYTFHLVKTDGEWKIATVN